MPQLIMVRGVPGTGKTTYAKALVDEYSYTHLEADMYFEHDGEYRFDASQLSAAHAWCQAECERAMQHGENVVVSNTFCQRKEMDVYLRMAHRHNYEVEIVSLTHEYGSVHNVPAEKMERFRARWQN